MPGAKNYKWIKIADNINELNISSNGLAEIEVNNKKVCIALHNDSLSACSQKCPHTGGILSQGYIDALGNIVCPVHRYKFSLQNGRNVTGEGYFLKTYPVEMRTDGIFIGFEENNLFNWLK